MKYSNKVFILFLIGIIIFNFMIYFGFNSAYFTYKNLTNLPDFYATDIYKYRVFSYEAFKYFEEFFNTFLNQIKEIKYFKNAMRNLGTNFYISLFAFNNIFLVLFLASLWKSLNLKLFNQLNSFSKLNNLIIITFIILISQYVRTPYDMSSYFFLAIGIWFSLKFIINENFYNILFLSIIILISTFNRETSAINLALLAALLCGFKNYPLKKNIKLLSLPTMAFLIVYIFLRIKFNNTQVVQNNYLIQNLTSFKNILGILIFLIISIYYYQQSTNLGRKVFHYFILFSLPYLITIFIGGILWEFRLFIPLIISYLMISILTKDEKHA